MTSPLLTCIICAFNEETRIERVLRQVIDHPLIDEIIVVDDGSEDATSLRVSEFDRIKLLRNSTNLGKSRAMARGISEACSNYVMLLDADLVGLRADHLSALARPVLKGSADVTMSMRGDSLYRIIGVDFVSGERVLPRALFIGVLDDLARTSPWGAEVFINELVIARTLRVDVVDWKDVRHVLKGRKVGSVRGFLSELNMTRDIMREIGARGLVRQNLALRSGAKRVRL